MILYIFNNIFPDNSGFAIRCKREIDAISKVEDIAIVCLGGNKQDKKYYVSNKKKIPIYFFNLPHTITENPKKYIAFIYEILRNFTLFINVGRTLAKAIKDNKNKKIRLYVVSSPLTLPLLTYFFSLIFTLTREIIEFHDLEPEMALHIKKISKTSIMYKIELLLERFLSQKFNHVIVTSDGQANTISKRAGILSDKISVIPNTVPEKKINPKNFLKIRQKYNLTDGDAILGYFSSFTFDYTVTGLKKLINKFPIKVLKKKTVKLFIVGDGEGLGSLKQIASQNKDLIFTGKITNVEDYTTAITIGIVPWEKDPMTETILPTKIFSYMVAKKPIIAPNFGEFKRILEHKKDAYLYNDDDDLVSAIILLSENTTLRESLRNQAYEKYLKFYTPMHSERELINLIKKV